MLIKPLFTLTSCKYQFYVFESVLNEMIGEHLPLKVVKRHSDDWPWVTDEFHNTINLRQYHFHANNTIEINKLRNKPTVTEKS